MSTDEETSERERAWLAAIIDSSDDAIVSKTLDGVITSWNLAAERIFGWTAAEAVGKHITLIIPRARHSEEDEILRRIRLGQVVDHFETIRVAKDGHLLNILLTVSPIRDRHGRIIGASKVARDVTESRRYERDRSWLASIIDSSDDAIVGKTLDGVITSWNRAAERIFGWTAAEAVGKHITLIIPRERWPEEETVLARIRAGELVDHFETVRVTKDGRLLDISLTVSPIKDGRGHIIGASKIARDVTERRRLEDERDRLSRQKDYLLATVSHELRTPLTSILGYARMLQSGRLDEAAAQHAVEVIVRSATTQTQLVEDLLDLSRIVTGRMLLTFEPCDIARLVREAVDTVRPAAEAKRVAITTHVSDDAGLVSADPERLRQVIWNIAMNAIKFTPGGGRVDVTMTRGPDEARIVVSDNGVGISPEVLPHVFEHFRQEDSSSTRAHAGLGLGLALVKHFVELHGGSVYASSPGKGQGATFTVSIPLSQRGNADGSSLHDRAAVGSASAPNAAASIPEPGRS